MIEQLVTSFVATAAFGVIFNVPRESLLRVGFVGMAGWFVYKWLVTNQYDSVMATFLAAFLIGSISFIFAKFYKKPVIIFSVSGIIPLVPGGLAYDAMRRFVGNDYTLAIELAAKVFMISGAIAMGLVFSEVMNQLIIKAKKKEKFVKRG